MISHKELEILQRLLSLSPEPEDTFSQEELLGYLFGLAMTPKIIPPEEWLPYIFGGHIPLYSSQEQAESMLDCLIEVLNRFTNSFNDNSLVLPYDINAIDQENIPVIYEWASGFEEALSLRDELWDPEEFPDLSNKKKEELFYSMMIIQGLVDPLEVMDFFEEMPEEIFKEVFPGGSSEDTDREMQIQIFLIASLPLAVQTLQNHARRLYQKSQIQRGKTPIHMIGKSQSPISTISSSQPIKKKAPIIQVNFPNHHKTKTNRAIFQLKVGLKGAKPPIWRRIQVPGIATLEQLHHIIQLSMGWKDAHLHEFNINATRYCPSHLSGDQSYGVSKNEKRYSLQDLDKELHLNFTYIYDFGDYWVHQIHLEKTILPEEGKPYPILLTGRRSCPPEDIGGIHGYLNALEVLQDPEDPEFAELINWLGHDFAPAGFDKNEIYHINEIFRKFPILG